MNIKLSDTSKLQAALDEVQRKARVRTITVGNIEGMCQRVFDKCGISKKAMDGVRFCADYNAQSFPGAYKGVPESTVIYATYKRGWVITDICRERTHSPDAAFRVRLTDEAKEAIISGKERFEH